MWIAVQEPLITDCLCYHMCLSRNNWKYLFLLLLLTYCRQLCLRAVITIQCVSQQNKYIHTHTSFYVLISLAYRMVLGSFDTLLRKKRKQWRTSIENLLFTCNWLLFFFRKPTRNNSIFHKYSFLCNSILLHCQNNMKSCVCLCVRAVSLRYWYVCVYLLCCDSQLTRHNE